MAYNHYGYGRPSAHTHICGLYIWDPTQYMRQYLPLVSLAAHATIQHTASRTVLTQTFTNPRTTTVPELRYTFPLYDGVSVVGFTCTINRTRVIRGIVKERAEARQTFDAAVAAGQTAGLLEQLPESSDVFTTTIGNVPAGAEVKVQIVYLGELKHDAQVDGVRYTIPTSIAPRYGAVPGGVALQYDGTRHSTGVKEEGGMEIVVDVDMPAGCEVQSVQSPSHTLAVSIGKTSTQADEVRSFSKASATLSLGSTALDKDFVLHVVASNTSNPIAILETHPTIPNQRALMATLVPKFTTPLPATKPEIVFVCDRSGSMGEGQKIPNLVKALQLFLKSLPVGVKFNIVSFGSRFEFLFKNGSKTYDAESLKKAEAYVARMGADFGGTEMYAPLEAVFKKRYADLPLEVFLLTDGEIWDQERLFGMVRDNVKKGNARVFSLGIGHGVSHSLIEGVARVGNGFAQSVGEAENMSAKLVRMLRASLTPHVGDYTLEVKYAPETEREKEKNAMVDLDDDGFEVIEKVMDGLSISTSGIDTTASTNPASPKPKKVISLFDNAAVEPPHDTHLAPPTAASRFANLPPLPPPKLLQSPWHIPPLYPFSRTTVYLLLSPSACKRTPSSIVLRGTSEHGPLELEVPVTVLEQKGETVHQLAARSAVGELEDGRSWVFDAKDAATGQLLKERYPGQFPDMVQREAVRLGVQFQVGGKWCSFVAVEANDDSITNKSLDQTNHSMIGNDEEDDEEAAEEYKGAAPLAFPAPPPPYAYNASAGNAHRVGMQMMQARQRQQMSPARSSMSHQLQPQNAQMQMAAPSASYSQYGMSASPSQIAGFDERLASLALPAGAVEYESSTVRSVMSAKRAPSGAFGFGSVGGAVANSVGGLFKRSSASGGRGGRGGRASAQASPDAVRDSHSIEYCKAAPENYDPTIEDSTPSSSAAQVIATLPMTGFSPSSSALPPAPRPSGIAMGGPGSGPGAASAASSPQDRKRKMKTSAHARYRNEVEEAAAMPTSLDDYDLFDDVPPLRDGYRDSIDVVQALVAMQGFGGEWGWSHALEIALDVGRAQAEKAVQEAGLQSIGRDVLATACVLVFLRRKIAGRRDEWELLGDKAEAWLEGQLGGRSGVERLLKAVEGLF
jgi:hypothetical protein